MNLNSTWKSIRIRHENERFQKATDNVVEKLALFHDQPQRVSTRLAKHILICYPTLIINGKTYSTQVRNIGAGVKEIYLKDKGEYARNEDT